MRYQVNVSRGWPIDAPIYPVGGEFESEDPRCAEGVKQGYLLICGDAPLGICLGGLLPPQGDEVQLPSAEGSTEVGVQTSAPDLVEGEK